MTEIQKILFSYEDKEYKEFNSKLIPNIDKNVQIGVRIPNIRKIAKEISGSKLAEEFTASLPHQYFEENNLHGYLIEKIKDFDECLQETEKFLPYIDNWATCDTISPKAFKKNLPKIEEKIKEWLSSDNTYTVRFAIGMLMKFFLDDEFKAEHLLWVKEIKSDEYYINMMRAWYFATAMAKKREETFPFFNDKKLDKWTHNKAIQKCVESYRISSDDKKYLKTLKVK